MIGDRIRELRMESGLSLSELARRANVSKSLVSQIEHGKANPSVDTVHAIASALEVPTFALFLEQNGAHSAIVRKNDRIRITVPGSQAVRELLTPALDSEIVLVISRIGPGATSSPRPVSHKGEECVYVTRGKLVLELQDESFVLETGDAIYFDARVPHLIINESDAEAEFIGAMSAGTLPPK